MQKKLKMCSLFSGIGGLELGLEAAVPGLRTCWQVEQDDFCRQVLKKHWPHAKRFEDVRTVELEHIRGADVICGGFPCQDISIAGKGAGLAGDRSGLWWEMHRLIGLALPRVVVAENVPALTGRGLSEVLCSLAECGYSSQWDIISAASVGAWHRRDRLFIIAYQTDSNGDGRGFEIKREQEHEKQQGASRCESDRLGKGRRGERSDNAADTDSRSIWDGAEREALGRDNVQTGGKAELAHDGAKGSPAHSTRKRLEEREGHNTRRVLPRLTRGYEGAAQSRICPVVDGVPRGMARRRRQQIKALGNAVVPQVAYQVGLRVKQILEEMNQ